MKAAVNPVIAATIVAVFLAAVGFAIWRAGEPAREAGAKPPGMPASAAAEMQRRMGGSGAITAPSASGTKTK